MNKFWAWNKFFTKYTIVGIVILIVSILLNQVLENYQSLTFFLNLIKIAADLLGLVGSALIIGAVFEFARTTQDFNDLIINNITKVMREKEFLGSLSPQEKRDDIIKIIGLDDMIHSDIKKYIADSVKDILCIANKAYRTNVFYSFRASITENNQIVFDGSIRYDIIKTRDTFGRIRSSFDNPKSTVKSVVVIHDGKRHELKIEKLDGVGKYEYSISIPDQFNSYEKLTIEQKITEYHSTLSTNFYIRTYSPLYCLNFSLICDSDLMVCDTFSFDNDDKFDIEYGDGKSSLVIKCSDWVSDSHGVVIHVRLKE